MSTFERGFAIQVSVEGTPFLTVFGWDALRFFMMQTDIDWSLISVARRP